MYYILYNIIKCVIYIYIDIIIYIIIYIYILFYTSSRLFLLHVHGSLHFTSLFLYGSTRNKFYIIFQLFYFTFFKVSVFLVYVVLKITKL